MAISVVDKSWMSDNRVRRAGVAIVFSIVVALISLFLDAHNLVFIGDLDKYLGDWRIAIFGQRAPDQRKDIALVLVTEDTLFDYPARSPVDRSLMADLVRAIDGAGPKAIGLDFIFDRRTDQDKALHAAIRGARNPVVLGAIDQRESGVSPRAFENQDEFFKAVQGGERSPLIGHLYLEEKPGGLSLSDQAVRRVAPPWPDANGRPSISRLLAETYEPKVKGRTPSGEISWLLPPWSGRSDTFLVYRLRNHKPSERKPDLAGLLSPAQLQSLKGRIVLIGAAMADSDRHRTPLTIRDGRSIPGVFIHAHRVAQLIDGRSIHEPGRFIKFLLLATVCLACFAMGRRLHRQTQIYDVMGLLLLGVITVTVFAVSEMMLPSAAMLLTWLAGFRAGRYSSPVFEWMGVKA